MPEENKIKKEDPKVDLDTSGPEVDVTLPEEIKEEVKEQVIETKDEETVKEVKEEPVKEEAKKEDDEKLEPKKEVTTEKTKLPKPTGWRMLVLPFRMDEKTKGGILLGGETIDRQQVASQCGNVIAMGDSCYKDKELSLIHI